MKNAHDPSLTQTLSPRLGRGEAYKYAVKKAYCRPKVFVMNTAIWPRVLFESGQ